jgi:hypothetical protein
VPREELSNYDVVKPPAAAAVCKSFKLHYAPFALTMLSELADTSCTRKRLNESDAFRTSATSAFSLELRSICELRIKN